VPVLHPSLRRGLGVLLLGLLGSGVSAAQAVSVAAARAVRTESPVVLDGRDADPIWRTAPVTDDFHQFAPAEAAPARFRTAFQVAYDDRMLYVFLRMYDPHPDSLIALLSRRDVRTPSEWIKVVIDGYHDRRSGMQFMVNPAGVKRDANITNDVVEDGAWDAVWDASTRIDSLGWTAEYAIPFSQLRFPPSEVLTFGFGIWRDDVRHGERDSWPVYRPSLQTFASQLGDLVGIEGIGGQRRLEVMPYVVTKNVTQPVAGGGWRHPQQQAAGLDVKAGLGPNITLDATLNPDFGQVEADPAVLNLSAFEIRFEERRPFFQEGGNLFRCGGPCEGIFYTRRLGRAPQLRSAITDPLASTIDAAAKLTGRLPSGLQFGLVGVSSAREVGASGTTIEPRTRAVVARVIQDFREGRSQIGTMITGLTRDLDEATRSVLRRDAYTVLVQGYHRFAERWEVSGYAGRTATRGSEAAIARTQLSSVHYAQRPGGELVYDPTRTSLSGGVTSASIRRYAGRVRWETTTRFAEPGTELNDMGLVVLVNDASIRNNLSFVSVRPSAWYRRAQLTFSSEQHWTSGGLPSGASVAMRSGGEFTNFWNYELYATTWNLGRSYCISCARGGPALRVSPGALLTVGLGGDLRKAIRPEAGVTVSRGDDGRSWHTQVEGGVNGRIGTRSSVELGLSYERRRNDTQPYANYGSPLSDTTHYTFARLDQTTLAVVARANVTLTPTLSLQFYAQPFVASGAFSDWREIADPDAAAYADRFASFSRVGSALQGYNAKQFNSNVVLRWEYRLGSTLFLVWQQGRADGRNPGTFDAGRDLRSLFATHPDNTLLLKFSYWFTP
jgi:hypothetical protein